MNFDETPHTEGDYFVSGDKKLLDHTWIVAQLLGQPWGDWLNHETIVEAIRNSDCYGLYTAKGRQIGFCRVVSDRATFHYLCDVVVGADYRGMGLGKFLVRSVVERTEYAQGVFLLRSKSPKFYEKFGFSTVEAMRRIPPK